MIAFCMITHVYCVHMASKSIQVRLDSKLKKRVEKIFAGLGIDLPTAVRIFFMKVTSVGGIPFDLLYPEDNYSPEQLAKLDRLVEKIDNGKEKLYGPFSNMKNLLEDLHKR